MINYIRVFIIFLLSATAFSAFAQNSATTSSPYSQYGLGLYDEPLLPLARGMGGIGTGLSKTPDGLSFINIINPASYSSITLTTIDIGAFANIVSLSRTGFTSQTSSNFRLSHVAFGIPVSRHSAVTFGILPYADLGYNYKQTNTVALNHSPIGVDTSATQESVYSGDGGLSKAYAGYGFSVGNFSFGGNVAYIFGKENQYRQVQYPDLPGVLNTNVQNSVSVGGLNYDYGVQYNLKLGETRRITFGYSGSAGSKINSANSFIVSHYTLNADGTQNLVTDSTTYTNTQGTLTLPQIHRFGITYEKDLKYLIGADFKIGQWSNLNINGVNAGLQNNQSFAIGGQITPNINSLSSYWAVVDYRLGFNYDNTYINVNNTNIKQYALTFGLGLPIPNTSRTNYYKVNFSAELGRRGSLNNSLVQENYINLHLGFTINEKWFQKYKFD